MQRLNWVYYWRIIYKEHRDYRLIDTGKYVQKKLRPSREALLCLDRESNEEKSKCFNLEEVAEMFVIKRKRQMLWVREKVENVSLEVISITESKFVII